MISVTQLDRVVVETLPELASDWQAYGRRRIEDPEFQQSFLSYSFIPTLQVALDQNVEDFCRRSFALIERLLSDGDEEVQSILRDEFFDYGAACEKWMQRAGGYLGPLARGASGGRS